MTTTARKDGERYRAGLAKARRAEREYIILFLRSKAAYDLCVEADPWCISHLLADFIDAMPEETL
jgi:hypothetical protein